MILKQYIVFFVLTSLCVSFAHLFLIENNSHLHLCISLFNLSNCDTSLLCCCAMLFLSVTTLLKHFITSLYDDDWTILKFLKDFDNKKKLVSLLGLASIYLLTYVEFPQPEKIKCILVTLYTSIIFVAALMFKSFDEVDYAVSQKSECSIGAYWAIGSVQAYYEKCLKQCRERMELFEQNNPGVKFLVKKLVLICPLSCYIEGSLTNRCAEITYVGDLQPIECDQGANYNRRLKTPVYEIYKDRGIFVAAEYPSPLGTLWEEKHKVDESVRVFIRDCFLKELKERLRPYPVLILEYDDQDPSSLHQFIVESLQNHLKENQY